MNQKRFLGIPQRAVGTTSVWLVTQKQVFNTQEDQSLTFLSNFLDDYTRDLKKKQKKYLTIFNFSNCFICRQLTFP